MRRTLILLAAVATAVSSSACSDTKRPDGGVGMLAAGAPAPEVSAQDQSGAMHKLSDERGKVVIVYFYPKDATPGCTKEACAFRDAWQKFQTAGVDVFGVSADDAKSHEQFAKEEKLPFPILADPNHAWSKAFGVSTSLGMDARVSFLIDKSGKVAKVYPDVDPAIHAEEVLRDAAALK